MHFFWTKMSNFTTCQSSGVVRYAVKSTDNSFQKNKKYI